jgi:hypothetical protein
MDRPAPDARAGIDCYLKDEIEWWKSKLPAEGFTMAGHLGEAAMIFSARVL